MDYTLRNIAMDAVKIAQIIVKNITKVQMPVEKIPGSGRRVREYFFPPLAGF